MSEEKNVYLALYMPMGITTLIITLHVQNESPVQTVNMDIQSSKLNINNV